MLNKIHNSNPCRPKEATISTCASILANQIATVIPTYNEIKIAQGTDSAIQTVASYLQWKQDAAAFNAKEEENKECA